MCCRAVNQAHDLGPSVARCTLRIFPLDALGSLNSTAGTTAKGTRSCRADSCGRMGRAHLLIAPPARAPAAAPATAAEPSVPTPNAATESFAAAASSNSSSSTPSPACAPDKELEVEMTDAVSDRKRAHSTVDSSSSAVANDDREPMARRRSQWWQQSAKMRHPLSGMRTRNACGGSDENILRTSHRIRRTSVCHARASRTDSSAIDGSTSLSAADTRCAVSSRSSQLQRISMPHSFAMPG